jgi:ribosomal protein S18 acetylase RimI-like enzyme
MPAAPLIRPATPADCAHLALLNDMATRRLASHLWAQSATAGQSPFEAGWTLIRTQADHFSHHANWVVAEVDGEVAAGMNTCLLPTDLPDDPVRRSPPVLQPLNALKVVAGGCWYVVALAVLPAWRGQGLAQALLAVAQAQARARGIDRLTLMVGSFNTPARALYARQGFAEWARRPFTPFAGSDLAGHWLLMRKDLAPAAGA